MIRLTGLSESPTYFEPVDGVLPTFRQMLLKHVGNKAPSNEDNAIEVYHVGTKILQAVDELDLETSEWKLVEEATKANSGKYVAYLQGQLLLKTQEWVAASKAAAAEAKKKAAEATPPAA